MNVELVPIGNLAPHPRNPRRGNVNAIAESFARFGQFKPLTVQRSTGHVLAGNHTLEALRALGHDEVPVIYLDVDDATATAILLADNRTSDLGGYDDRELARLLADLDDLTGIGFTDADAAALYRTTGLLAADMEQTFATIRDDATTQIRTEIAPDVAAARNAAGWDRNQERVTLNPSEGTPYNPNTVTAADGTPLVQMTLLLTPDQRTDIATAARTYADQHDTTISDAIHRLVLTGAAA